jgi:hypothetical protein
MSSRSMLEIALKGAGVGAGVGAAMALISSIVHKRKEEAVNNFSVDVPYLASDSELFQSVIRLGDHRSYDSEMYDKLVEACNELVELYIMSHDDNQKHVLKWQIKLNRMYAKIVRLCTQYVKIIKEKGGDAAVADEQIKTLLGMCDNYVHNIMLSSESRVGN